MNASSPLLVTGATGFIGAHLVRALVRDGYVDVRALVRPGSDGSAHARNGVRCVTGDLTDAGSLRRAVAGCDTVYHLAAATSRLTTRSAKAYTEANVAGTLALLDACSGAGVRHVVLCSSSGVYGRLRTVPIREDGPLHAETLYGRSKLESERSVWPRLDGTGPTIAIGRPAAVYGPGSANWLPLFRDVASQRIRMLGDGAHPYHCTHVDDVVAGLRCCARPEAAGGVYNLAAASAPSLREVLATIASVLGVPFAPRHIPAWPFAGPVAVIGALTRLTGRESGLASRAALFTEPRAYDISRAVREIGYAPRVTLREGIESMVRWFRETGQLA